MINLVDIILENNTVYKITFEADHILLFTVIPWGEYKSIRLLKQSMPSLDVDIDEYIFKKCTLAYFSKYGVYKKDYIDDQYLSIEDLFEKIPAGVISVLSNAVSALSGAKDSDILMNAIQNERNTSQVAIEDAIAHVIMSVFGFSNKDLDQINWDNVVKSFVQAENILQGIIPIPLELRKQTSNNIDFSKEDKDLNELQ